MSPSTCARQFSGHAERYAVGTAVDDRKDVVPGSGGNEHARAVHFVRFVVVQICGSHLEGSHSGQSSHHIWPQQTIRRGEFANSRSHDGQEGLVAADNMSDNAAADLLVVRRGFPKNSLADAAGPKAISSGAEPVPVAPFALI